MKNKTMMALEELADIGTGMIVFYKDGDTYTASILDEDEEPIIAVQGYSSVSFAIKNLSKKWRESGA